MCIVPGIVVDDDGAISHSSRLVAVIPPANARKRRLHKVAAYRGMSGGNEEAVTPRFAISKQQRHELSMCMGSCCYRCLLLLLLLHHQGQIYPAQQYL